MHRVYLLDWGILDSLRALNRGRLSLSSGRDPQTGDMNESNRNWIVHEMIAPPGDSVFIDHTQGSRLQPSVQARLEAIAQSAGYRRQTMRTIADRNGWPVFEVFRFVSDPAAAR
jgi:hypothetical protein